LIETEHRGWGLGWVRSWQLGYSWVAVQELRKDPRAAASEKEIKASHERRASAERQIAVLQPANKSGHM